MSDRMRGVQSAGVMLDDPADDRPADPVVCTVWRKGANMRNSSIRASAVYLPDYAPEPPAAPLIPGLLAAALVDPTWGDAGYMRSDQVSTADWPPVGAVLVAGPLSPWAPMEKGGA
jgi:hypothetical protein